MNVIKPSFEILDQDYSIDGIKKQIEIAGRTCYKSLDKITDESCNEFVDRMINSNHTAMLEHGTVYLQIPKKDNILNNFVSLYVQNPYSVVKYNTPICDMAYITTNYRVIVENKWFETLNYICKPTQFHEKRVTVHFICNRQVSHEFVRHRTFSFAQESTRYCNYTKGKFGSELTFIEPSWVKPEEMEDIKYYFENIERTYFYLVNDKQWLAQEAATFLPNAIKTELVMTGFVKDWKHFFDLRADGNTGAPHPQAKELAAPLKEEFIKRQLL
jgi:thymidylate synthase (FAD)